MSHTLLVVDLILIPCRKKWGCIRWPSLLTTSRNIQGDMNLSCIVEMLSKNNPGHMIWDITEMLYTGPVYLTPNWVGGEPITGPGSTYLKWAFENTWIHASQQCLNN